MVCYKELYVYAVVNPQIHLPPPTNYSNKKSHNIDNGILAPTESTIRCPASRLASFASHPTLSKGARREVANSELMVAVKVVSDMRAVRSDMNGRT